jgi:hypothetical protein
MTNDRQFLSEVAIATQQLRRRVNTYTVENIVFAIMTH